MAIVPQSGLFAIVDRIGTSAVPANLSGEPKDILLNINERNV